MLYWSSLNFGVKNITEYRSARARIGKRQDRWIIDKVFIQCAKVKLDCVI